MALDKWFKSASTLRSIVLKYAYVDIGSNPIRCKKKIWLGSIVANALDCLSSYRGFESHPSRCSIIILFSEVLKNDSKFFKCIFSN